MRVLIALLAILISIPTMLVQGQDDPFGGGGADPFGDAAPARGAKPAAADPFGGVDPFAKGRKQSEQRHAAKSRPMAGKDSAVKTLPKRDPSEATARIRSVLNDETAVTFIETPLEEVVSQLSQMHDIPIVIDRRSLEEIGIAPDVPVTISLKRVSLRSALRLMLRQFDLTYLIKDEVLQITTIEAAERNLTFEMYRFPEVLTPKADKVLAALTASVSPDVWSELGGDCHASVLDNVLVISATENVHEDVNEFLQKLQLAFERHKAKQ